MTCPTCLSLTEENDALAEKLQDARNELALKRDQLAAAYTDNIALRGKVKRLERATASRKRKTGATAWPATRVAQ